MEKPRIDYPCTWSYKVVGADAAALDLAVAEVMGEQVYTICASNTSRTGKYVSVRVETVVHDEENRVGIFMALGAHESVRIVL